MIQVVPIIVAFVTLWREMLANQYREVADAREWQERRTKGQT